MHSLPSAEIKQGFIKWRREGSESNIGHGFHDFIWGNNIKSYMPIT